MSCCSTAVIVLQKAILGITVTVNEDKKLPGPTPAAVLIANQDPAEEHVDAGVCQCPLVRHRVTPHTTHPTPS